jgi:hypothetical protein
MDNSRGVALMRRSRDSGKMEESGDVDRTDDGVLQGKT